VVQLIPELDAEALLDPSALVDPSLLGRHAGSLAWATSLAFLSARVIHEADESTDLGSRGERTSRSAGVNASQ
jgi:hypothetical protein